MRIFVTAIATALLTVPTYAQWAQSGTGRQQQGRSTPAPNAFPCKAFTKNERGNWYVKGPVTIDIGSEKNRTLQNVEIPPKFFTIGGVGLFETIQKHCGG